MPLDHAWRDITRPGDMLQREFKYDTDGSWLVRHKAPGSELEDALKLNKAFYNAERKTTALWQNPNLTRVASIPMHVAEQWYHQEGLNIFRWNEETQLRVLQKLDDIEWRGLRVAPGRLL